MRRIFASFPAAAIMALVSAAGPGPAAAQATAEKPTVAGAWTLNAEKSDDVRERMTAALRNRRPPAGMPGRGGVTGGGARGGRGGQGGAMDPPQGGALPDAGGMAMLQGARSLRIEFSEATVVLHRDEMPPLELKTDGTALVQGPEGRHVEYKAKWNGNKLELETRAENGPRVTETYTLDGKDPAVLSVDVRFAMPGPDGSVNVRLKRVYDRR